MRLTVFLCVMFCLLSCATIVRKDIHKQKLVVKDAVSNEGIANVKVQVNGTDVGSTNKDGLIIFPIEQKNKQDGYSLALTSNNYLPVTLEVKNGLDGGYLTGDIFLFFLGIIPGVVGLVVDGVTGEWYSYKDSIVLQMQPK